MSGPALAHLRLMRMHAGRKPHRTPRRRHLAGPPRLAVVFRGEDAQRALEPRRPARGRSTLVQLGLEDLIGEMAVGVDHDNNELSPT